MKRKHMMMALWLASTGTACGALEGNETGDETTSETSQDPDDGQEVSLQSQAVTVPFGPYRYHLRRPGLNLAVAVARQNGAYLVVREGVSNQTTFKYDAGQIRVRGEDLCVQHQGLGNALRLAPCSRGGTRWNPGSDGRIRYEGDARHCIMARGEDNTVIAARCDNNDRQRWDWSPVYRYTYSVTYGPTQCRAGIRPPISPVCPSSNPYVSAGGSCWIVRPTSTSPGVAGSFVKSYTCRQHITQI